LTLFVDASALVAMMKEEPEARALREQMGTHAVRLTSGLAQWEAALAISRGDTDGPEAALVEVQRYCDVFGITIVPIAAAEAQTAILAHARYGKGTRHPARLNMGDCFAYACAKANGAKLLYKGDDFIHTDLR
jgi:ribonuclease VapC